MTKFIASDRITTLLAGLASRDLFERENSLAEIRECGVEALPEILSAEDLTHAETAIREIVKTLDAADREMACTYLVRALRRDRPLELRRLGLNLLGEQLAGMTGHVERVLELGLDDAEPEDLRVRSFRVLRRAGLPVEFARQIGAMLKIETLGPRCSEGLRDSIFECLKIHADKLPVEQTMRQLDPFLHHPEPAIRTHALALLGEVGDLDAIERMCVMPNTAAEIDRIQQAIGRIMLRPTNLLSMRPDHFEVFISHFLRKLEHYEVEVIGRVGDDGVDLKSCQRRNNAKGPSDERWAVQCKRWATRKVSAAEVRAFVETSREEKFNAKHALFITTSDFTREAHTFAEANSSAVELMSGKELIAALDKHFGAERYTIRSRE